MRLRFGFLVASAAIAITSGNAAADQSVPADFVGKEGKLIGETIFKGMDTGNKGFVHMGDIEAFRESSFLAMDYDDNAQVTYREFAEWDPGFARVAAEVGRSDAYTTASKIIFAIWDRDGDGEMTQREMRLAINADFHRADQDGDALLTMDEFVQGFPIMIAMRAAIRPDL